MPLVLGVPVPTLAETGCFADVATLTPSPDLVPYGVAAPLWTDGAHKTRYFSIPTGTQLTIVGNEFELPVGSVLVKIFTLDVQREGVAENLRIEVRFLVKTESGTRLFSYRFDDSGTGAALVEASDTLSLVAADGQPVEYYLPHTTSCGVCHGGDLRVLGFTPAQLDFAFDYGPGRATTHQLDALASVGWLDDPRLASADELADPHGPEPLELRARSWLHTNCAHCHRPGGYAPGSIDMDMRVGTPLSETGLCDAVRFGTFVRYFRLAPGFPDYSGIVLRAEASGFDRMPPVGVSRVDAEGIGVVREWITQLESCGE